MSDRCVFAGYLSRDYADDHAYTWADVVVRERATLEEIQAAADAFCRLPGPHKVFVPTREDPRFRAFARYLSEAHAMEEDDSLWGYGVRVSSTP